MWTWTTFRWNHPILWPFDGPSETDNLYYRARVIVQVRRLPCTWPILGIACSPQLVRSDFWARTGVISKHHWVRPKIKTKILYYKDSFLNDSLSVGVGRRRKQRTTIQITKLPWKGLHFLMFSLNWISHEPTCLGNSYFCFCVMRIPAGPWTFALQKSCKYSRVTLLSHKHCESSHSPLTNYWK